MRFIHFLVPLCPLFGIVSHADCLKVAKEKSVEYERNWIEKNESASASEIKSVVVAKGDDGKDSTWTEKTPRGIMYGVFIESQKTEDNTHWEILLESPNCREIGKGSRKNAP